ncbi:MAG: sterol desaturase family protein, partial [Luminiphilus sp.]|nr:sterol desaturase family protein [Luminiphilus sp.]
QLTPLSTAGYWVWWFFLAWTGVATAGWLQGKQFTLMCLMDLPRLLLFGVALSSLVVTGWWGAFGWLWLGLSLLILVLEYRLGLQEAALQV